jgi:hypothetical protein
MASAPLRVAGRCLCGDIRFEAEGPILSTNHCHCESCRRATSSPFTTWLTVRAEELRWDGAPASFASSLGVTRRFCPRCGSPLSYEVESRPGEVDLLAATLDDHSGFVPVRHDHWAEHVTWVALADDLPKE